MACEHQGDLEQIPTEGASVITFKAVGLSDAIKSHKTLGKAVDKSIIRNVKKATLRGTSEIRNLASGEILKVRSGRYRASVRHKFEDGGKTGKTGPNVIYAAQKEYGGTIKPKKAGGWLTIPLRGAMTASGVARRRITQYEGFFHMTSDNRLFFMGSPTSGSDRVVPLFRLVKSVKQKPKRVVGTAHENIEDEVSDAFRKDIHKTIGRAIG